VILFSDSQFQNIQDFVFQYIAHHGAAGRAAPLKAEGVIVALLGYR
jgi:hypothetical protein